MNSNLFNTDNLFNIGNIIRLVFTAATGIVLLVALRLIFREKDIKSDKIHRRFLRRLFNLVVIVICLAHILEIFDPSMNFTANFWKGSALVVAILGFAAQAAISDMICGFLISINKPFEIGDRIIVEGEEPGIVVDITLRHTVLKIYDDHRVTIPNSVLNSKTITNTTKSNERIGIHLKYSVSYDTNVVLAMDVIRDCVVASPYTLPVERNGIVEDSGPVYFLKFDESALILETTIWITHDTSSYVAITDMNVRVNNAFREHGIEIPYNYINVVERENVAYDAAKLLPGKKKAPAKRHFRTDTITIHPGSEDIKEVLDVARIFAARQRLDEDARNRLSLMTEELVGLAGEIAEDAKAKFWIEGSGIKYRIHLNFNASIGSEERARLVSLSSSGKNDAGTSLPGKLWEKVVTGLRTTDSTAIGSGDYEWSLHDNEPTAAQIGESILMAMADDIKVSVTKEHVEITVIKSDGNSP